MKNFKVNIPAVLAIALAVTLTQCHTDKIKEEAERNRLRQKIENSIVSIDEAFIPVDIENKLFNPETGELEELEVKELPKVKIK